MLNEGFEQFFERVLFESLGEDTDVISYEFVSGGCINVAAKLITPAGYFFIKWNESTDADMFEKEAFGLELLKAKCKAYVPEVINFGKAEGKSYLLLEFVHPELERNDFWEDFGTKLAKLHYNSSITFGLSSDNYIGSLEQSNTPNENWLEFFMQKRVMAQAGLAYYNQLLDKKILDDLELLGAKLPSILVHEPPALIHGDLWSGNFLIGPDGGVCLIDPAVYYANREAEIAFTLLFGGFEERFYEAYFDAFPVEKGFSERAAIYNLYPLLVHVNIFGGSYITGVQKILKKYL